MSSTVGLCAIGAPSGAQYAQIDEIAAGTVELPVREIEIDLGGVW